MENQVDMSEKAPEPVKVKTPTITLCCITRNEEDWIELPLRSCLPHVDEIVIADDMSQDNTKKVVEQFQKMEGCPPIKFIQKDFKKHFGNQRQECVKNATSDWLLWLDADECVSESIINLKKFLTANPTIDCYHIEYEHFIHNFKKLDSSVSIHRGICRLYRRYDSIDLTKNANHVLPLLSWFKAIAWLPGMKIWHMGYAKNMLDIYDRYKRNVLFSEIHDPLEQIRWRNWHYGMSDSQGKYPDDRRCRVEDIPKALRDMFEMDWNDVKKCTSERGKLWVR